MAARKGRKNPRNKRKPAKKKKPPRRKAQKGAAPRGKAPKKPPNSGKAPSKIKAAPAEKSPPRLPVPMKEWGLEEWAVAPRETKLALAMEWIRKGAPYDMQLQAAGEYFPKEDAAQILIDAKEQLQIIQSKAAYKDPFFFHDLKLDALLRIAGNQEKVGDFQGAANTIARLDKIEREGPAPLQTTRAPGYDASKETEVDAIAVPD